MPDTINVISYDRFDSMKHVQNNMVKRTNITD